jgi:hypothetical protein
MVKDPPWSITVVYQVVLHVFAEATAYSACEQEVPPAASDVISPAPRMYQLHAGETGNITFIAIPLGERVSEPLAASSPVR